MLLKIQDELKGAMKAGDSLRVSVLRMLLSELNYKKIDAQRDLTDEEVLQVIQKEVKKRKEAVESYTAGGRLDQVKQEQDELAILQVYLPAQMDESAVRAELIAMNLPKDFPQAMKLASPVFKNRADGSVVAKIVRELVA